MVCVMRVFFAHVFSQHGVCDAGGVCTCVVTAWCNWVVHSLGKWRGEEGVITCTVWLVIYNGGTY